MPMLMPLNQIQAIRGLDYFGIGIEIGKLRHHEPITEDATVSVVTALVPTTVTFTAIGS